MSKNMNCALSAQWTTGKPAGQNADRMKNIPAPYSRPPLDASLLSAARKLIEYGRSFSAHSSAYWEISEARAQRLVKRQERLLQMQAGITPQQARAHSVEKTSASEFGGQSAVAGPKKVKP
ncbi:hypothetical protein ACSFA3_17970 [Variovorax sp. RHLX14]|uniref:hypothetical protein n=1 Tax=Variovorax sp. RHLX14 TaxID=1259731 RepID=UPI003F48048E